MPVTSAATSATARVLRLLATREPHISGTVEGGVSVEWRGDDGGEELSLKFDADGILKVAGLGDTFLTEEE